MTNEQIAKKYSGWGGDGLLNIYDLMNLARQDEREKMTEEKVKEYLGGLGGKEAALIVLNYLLRGGITDDDLRGLRLQWINYEREKMQGVDCFITASKHYAEIYVGGDKPKSMIWGHFYKGSRKDQHCSRLNRHTARLLGVELNQCKKFRIVEVVE